MKWIDERRKRARKHRIVRARQQIDDLTRRINWITEEIDRYEYDDPIRMRLDDERSRRWWQRNDLLHVLNPTKES